MGQWRSGGWLKGGWERVVWWMFVYLGMWLGLRVFL